MPPFWHAPELWIAQIESQFVSVGITTEQTKYHTLAVTINSSMFSQVSDVILKMSEEDQYSNLKKIYAGRVTRKLLQDTELGHLRPSPLLRGMKNSAGNNVHKWFLKSMWITRLPKHMRSIISVIGELCNKTAIMAKKF